jgi:hypothetical protein
MREIWLAIIALILSSTQDGIDDDVDVFRP